MNTVLFKQCFNGVLMVLKWRSNTGNVIFSTSGWYIYMKAWASYVTRSTCRGSGIAQFVETSNAKAPRQCKYIENSLDDNR